MGKGYAHKQGRTVTFADGEWTEGDPRLVRTREHGFWLSSTVFDGARALAGRTPDLDLHCARVIDSARIMGLDPKITTDEIVALSREAVAKFDDDAELYISPMFFAEEGFIIPDPASTRFVLSVFEAPLPEPKGFSACLTRYRRPARDMAPTQAKASCLYPNVARGVREVNAKGFDTGVVLDPNGNVAEFCYTNLFLAKDGVVHTPAINGTFLNGITRQRVIRLLRDSGVEVHERAIDFAEVVEADELFGTGNYAKVVPCTRLEDRALQPGPLYRQARELYFQFSETT